MLEMLEMKITLYAKYSTDPTVAGFANGVAIDPKIAGFNFGINF